jgi:hypothetical protein
VTSTAHRQGGEWLAAAHEDPFRPATWTATFDATTPVEIVRDFYTALLTLYEEDARGERDLLYPDDVRPQEVYLPLLSAGWRDTVKTDGTQYFRSSDGYGVLQHTYIRKNSATPVWSAWGGPPDNPLWKAIFSAALPASLVGAFASSMASTVPLARAVWSLPAETRLHLTLAEPRPESARQKLTPPNETPGSATVPHPNGGAIASSTGPTPPARTGLPASRRR